MKILIIELPRTGSTSLLNEYSLKYNLKKIEEPFNIKNLEKLNENNLNEDNIVLKTIIDQIPLHEINHINYWFNKSKEFDKIILLSRKDLNACAESLSFLDYNKKYGFKYNEKYEWYLTPNFKKWYEYLVRVNKDLLILGKLLNIETTYYEDVFDLNSNERLRIGNLKPYKII